MEELIDEDKVKKYYCLDCNSKNIKELGECAQIICYS